MKKSLPTRDDPRKDGLEPVQPLDLGRVTSVDDLIRGYCNASFGARRLGQAAEVLETMVSDPESLNVLTLSGAMTVAKMGLVICEMIERGYVDLIISTGALMTHGLVENSGGCHYKWHPGMDDEALYRKRYNRVYDTLEPESNLDEAMRFMAEVLEDSRLPEVLSSHVLTRAIGRILSKRYPDQRGPLLAAYRHQVPIIIPALTDSEMGLDIAIHNQQRLREGLPRLPYDPFLDLDFYADRVRQASRLGIFTIGGGVPRNYAQQVGPYLDLAQDRLGDGKAAPVRFQYGVRICPDSEHLGGLSGCTYSEGVSWGKFVPASEGGRYAEVLADATIAWPLVVKAVMERVPQRPDRKG